MFDLLLFVLPSSLVFLAILLGLTIVTASWRWVTIFILLFAGILAWAWTDHSIAAKAPGHIDGQMEALFVVAFTIATYAFAIALVVYLAGIIWWKYRI